MCAMPIAIHIVIKLAVVHYLAVGGADPVQVTLGVSQVRATAWSCCGGVCEGAVQPVDACVTHAYNLVLAI